MNNLFKEEKEDEMVKKTVDAIIENIKSGASAFYYGISDIFDILDFIPPKIIPEEFKKYIPKFKREFEKLKKLVFWICHHSEKIYLFKKSFFFNNIFLYKE